MTLIVLSSAAIVAIASKKHRRPQGGHAKGKAANNDLNRIQAAIGIDTDYFWRLSSALPLFSEKYFERLHGMPVLFTKGCGLKICEVDDYFTERKDALGVVGASTDQKMTSALRQIFLGVSVDAVVEYLRLSNSTNS